MKPANLPVKPASLPVNRPQEEPLSVRTNNLPVKPIVASTPAPFQPVKYEDDAFSADGYLPPLDVRTEEDLSDWETWKVILSSPLFSYFC